MNNQEGFWYSFGDACYSFFEILESTYELLSPNKILIVVGFVAVSAWVYVQHKYNQKAIKENGMK